jgi:BarA-like signal transduction histidine kinase
LLKVDTLKHFLNSTLSIANPMTSQLPTQKTVSSHQLSQDEATEKIVKSATEKKATVKKIATKDTTKAKTSTGVKKTAGVRKTGVA